MNEIAPARPRRRWLRLVAIMVPAALFFGVVAYATFTRSNRPGIGDTVPDFSAPLLGSEGDLALSDLRGKPVVLNFWASWCTPCDDEAPAFRAAAAAYGDRVQFLGVNARDARSDALAKLEEWGLGYPSVRDETGEIYSSFGLSGQPETFFIDAEGELVQHAAGPVFENDLEPLLQDLLRR